MKRSVIFVGFKKEIQKAILCYIKAKKPIFLNSIPNHKINTTTKYYFWANRDNLRKENLLRKIGADYTFCEDGFVRSSGLGLTRAFPASFTFSKRSSHINRNTTSDLETLLNTANTTLLEKNLGLSIIEKVKKHKISKYNLSYTTPFPLVKNNKKNVLIIGQVENDASIMLGSKNTHSNKTLIENTLNIEGDCNYYYKPHPDVLTGKVKGDVCTQFLNSHHIKQVTNVGIQESILACDTVHVITSQSGLDALMLNKEVTCHGNPFYSGWGLTNDLVHIQRRHRNLSLCELIFISYALYPTYIDPLTRNKTKLMKILDLIANKTTKWPQI